MTWFDSPNDAAEAEADLAAAGYTFERTPYVFDEDDGILLTPTVYGVIFGYPCDGARDCHDHGGRWRSARTGADA
jgi:hypothetical protein